ncbi:MAG: carbohydrate ABC transporter permease, partial [Anaerolineaceae bacterium]|nr:carbohydrate ABC transporter permease [Anaerolineaceae bacterium]
MAILEKNTPLVKEGETRHKRQGFRLSVGQFFVYLILLIGIIYTLLPFLWMLGTSFKSATEIVRMPPTLIPEKFSLNSYQTIFTDPRVPLARFYLNSIIVSFSIVGMVLFT